MLNMRKVIAGRTLLESAGKSIADIYTLGPGEVPGLSAARIAELRRWWAESRPPVVVTRHPALVTYLREVGVVTGEVEVKAHVTPDDVLGRRVIGVLPLHLASLAYEVTEVQLDLRPEDRGKELGLGMVRERARGIATYSVARVR